MKRYITSTTDWNYTTGLYEVTDSTTYLNRKRFCYDADQLSIIDILEKWQTYFRLDVDSERDLMFKHYLL